MSIVYHFTLGLKLRTETIIVYAVYLLSDVYVFDLIITEDLIMY